MNLQFSTVQEQLKYSFETFGNNDFLGVHNEVYSYKEIYHSCQQLAQVIYHHVGEEEKLIGIMGDRSKYNYVGLYGTLLSGYAYLPINPKHPAERLVHAINFSEIKQLVLCKEAVKSFQLIANELNPLTIICVDDKDNYKEIISQFKQHDFVSILETDITNFELKKIAKPDDLAYVIFTSGSTGVPKGVMISQENLLWYANYCIDHYQVTSADRISQSPDVSFDLSVHDLYISVLSGASLHVLPAEQKMAPGRFIRDKKITFWTSVPSVILFMDKLRMLKPGIYPDVRNTMFCGEALPAKSAEKWQNAVPNAFVENTYGPTECTVAVTNYHWRNEHSPQESINGIVSLGVPFPHQQICLIDEDLNPVANGEIGEICIGGPQVAKGYYKDEEKTKEKFVTLTGKGSGTWYRTGDLGRFNTENGQLYFEGRMDDQVKIRGYRVELQEIDHAMENASENRLAISLPVSSVGVQGYSKIFGIVEGKEDIDLKVNILNVCRSLLPEYMVPEKIIFIDKVPLNANGKINRKKLKELYGTE